MWRLFVILLLSLYFVSANDFDHDVLERRRDNGRSWNKFIIKDMTRALYEDIVDMYARFDVPECKYRTWPSQPMGIIPGSEEYRDLYSSSVIAGNILQMSNGKIKCRVFIESSGLEEPYISIECGLA